jgi:hypothetical protein
MKIIAFLLVGFASVAVADEPFYSSPLIVEGSSSIRGSSTTYVLKLKNLGNRPIEKLRIFRAGMPIHYVSYNPRFVVARIPSKGCYELRFTLRGALAPAPDSRDYGIEADYRYGNDGMSINFPQPCRKPGL